MGVLMNYREKYLRERISHLLRARGLKLSKVEQEFGSIRPDLVFRSRFLHLLVECKPMNLYRAADFRAAIGDSILRFQREHHSARSRSNRLMLAFLLRRSSKKAEDDLREYSRKYLSDLQWAIIAEDGSGIIHIGDREERVSVLPFQSIVHDSSRGRWVSASAHVPSGSAGWIRGSRASLFSPNNQWLFKILLLSGIDSKYWGGPPERPESISDLSEVSDVPQPSVSAFVIKAEQEGFLKREPRVFLVQNHQELLDDWSYALKNRRRVGAIGVRYLYPDESEENFLRKLQSYCRAQEAKPLVVGGHLGCHLLGVGRSNVRSMRLYAAESFDKVMSALDLVEDKAESPQLSLVVRPPVDSVFRSAVRVNGVPVCDILHCYFDVRFSYARGKEQADYIYERILQPHFEKAE
jgi:hypothetical protein